MYVARGREITARKVNLQLGRGRDAMPAKLGERECITTDGMEQICQKTHWATFYHKNRELKESISVQYAN